MTTIYRMTMEESRCEAVSPGAGISLLTLRVIYYMGLTMMDLFPDAASAADGRKVPSETSQRKTLSLLDLALEKQLP
jgi:hypothetical protein